MSPESAPYEGDPESWNSYLAEGNAKQARKRVSVDALLRDDQGRVLLVDPKYKPCWDIPGGMAEANEPPTEAVSRELREELGIDIRVGRLLCVDWVPPHGPWDDLLNFIFDGGVLAEAHIAQLRLADEELNSYGFFEAWQARERLRPDVGRRLSVALDATDSGSASFLLNSQIWPLPQ
jgi:ADP-ribose pyrophosphatase YjhB (NUDIX family)